MASNDRGPDQVRHVLNLLLSLQKPVFAHHQDGGESRKEMSQGPKDTVVRALHIARQLSKLTVCC